MASTSRVAVLKAAMVHLITASGAMVSLVAVLAVFDGRKEAALLWLLVALILDGIDGPLARKFAVREHLPKIDGATLDLIVDFLTYVVVPVLYMLQFELFPSGWSWPMVAIIVFSSLYLFVHTEMKSVDNYFNGFPAAWNLVLFFWVIMATPLAFNIFSTLVLSVLTFVPIKSIHPVRVRRLSGVNIALVTLWLALSAVLFVLGEEAQGLLTWLWFAVTSWFLGFSLWRTFSGKPKE